MVKLDLLLLCFPFFVTELAACVGVPHSTHIARKIRNRKVL